MRSRFPRFTEQARQANQPVVDLLRRTAAAKDATPAQIALAWLLHRSPHIVPIPGTRNPERLRENLAAAAVTLTEAEMRQIDDTASAISITGGRGTGHARPFIPNGWRSPLHARSCRLAPPATARLPSRTLQRFLSAESG